MNSLTASRCHIKAYLDAANQTHVLHDIQKEKRDKTKNVLSDQSSISFRVGHWHVQTINMTYQLVTIEIKIIYIYEQ